MCKVSKDYGIPVDSENKATVLRIWSMQHPHMRSFHLAWTSFFTAFVSTFAPAAMIPVIRDDLDLVKADLGNAAVASMLGIVGSRIIMGSVCDWFGPRYGHAIVMGMTSPAVFGIGLINGAGGFIACRIIIGFGLATFVATQFWCSVLFNVKIVGMANATSAGWGNLGGGVTQLLMPVVYEGILKHETEFIAWRYAFFIPGCLHILVCISVLLFGQDLPEGQYHELKKDGSMQANNSKGAILAILNYRTWIMTILYGMCFGVELTINNIINSYFTDQFDLPISTAGLCGSLFGLMNLFARSLGGYISDTLAKPFGMRGRLWAYFFTQFVEGLFCILVGFLQGSLAGTIVVIVMFSSFVQAAEGASFGIVPFISKRGLGVVAGLVGAGGNAGSGLMLALFFQGDILDIPTYEGLRYTGVFVAALTALLCPLMYFPMWGGMFCGPKAGVTEEDYYGGEYSPEERAQGLADKTLKFARESRSQRGSRYSGKGADSAPEEATT